MRVISWRRLILRRRKNSDIKHAFDNIPYLRRGAQNLPQNSPERLERLRYSKGIISYEDQIINADPITISNSLAAIEFSLEIIPSAEPETWLRKQKVIVAIGLWGRYNAVC